RVETGKNIYFLKWNANTLPGLFEKEAVGLSLLAATKTVIVPEVLAFSERTNATPAYILLEWLEGSGNADQALLGEQLAALHRSASESAKKQQYGLDHDNYIGSTPQYNHPEPDWPTFFIQQRLLPLITLNQQQGRLTPERITGLEKLIDRLPDLLNRSSHSPSLIHGDLWSGNVINSPRGLALVDPAASYSDREAEIAYTELFGGFNARFYDAYQRVWPLQAGYPERRDLYNLYHLLNHLHLFGESYGYQVDLILRRYT
ncbi:MAG: fructosamine kinase family protein, partial [Anaerolineaceae bacterium]|nr:fructosamine kinase family protein [Anaerolineaceae bacterium]